MATIYFLKETLSPRNVVRKEEKSIVGIIKEFIGDSLVQFEYIQPLGSGFPVARGIKKSKTKKSGWHIVVKIGLTDPRSEWFPHAGYYLIKKRSLKKKYREGDGNIFFK